MDYGEINTIVNIISLAEKTEFDSIILNLYFEKRRSPIEIISIINYIDERVDVSYSMNQIIALNEFRRQLIQTYFP